MSGQRHRQLLLAGLLPAIAALTYLVLVGTAGGQPSVLPIEPVMPHKENSPAVGPGEDLDGGRGSMRVTSDMEGLSEAVITALDRLTGDPVAALRLRLISGSEAAFALVTDTSGAVVVPSGRYQVKSEDDRYQVLTHALTAKEHDGAIVWCAPLIRLRLLVVDTDGGPVHGARVSLTGVEGDPSALGETNMAGELVLTRLPISMNARLAVVHPDFLSCQTTLPIADPGSGDCTVVLRRGVRRVLQLVDMDSRPHQGARVTGLTADVRLSEVKPLLLGETDQFGYMTLPGDINDLRQVRIEGTTVFPVEIRDIQIRPSVTNVWKIPGRVPTTFKTTRVGAIWRLMGPPASADMSESNQIVLNAVPLEAALDGKEVQGELPEGIFVDVEVSSGRSHAQSPGVFARGAGFVVSVALDDSSPTRSVFLSGEVDRVGRFEVYELGKWRPATLTGQGKETHVDLPVDALSCRITSTDGQSVAAWAIASGADSSLRVQFPPRHSVTLRLSDPEGAPIRDVRLMLRLVAPRVSDDAIWTVAPFRRSLALEVGAAGTANVDLEAGAWEVALGQLERGQVVDRWPPLRGGHFDVNADLQVDVVAHRPRLVAVHVAVPVPPRWNLVALPGKTFITCFGKDASVLATTEAASFEAQRLDGVVFATGVLPAGSAIRAVTLESP